jgi:hypothetical protein
VELLGGEQGEAVSQVKAFLRTEYREGTCAGAVFLSRSMIENET